MAHVKRPLDFVARDDGAATASNPENTQSISCDSASTRSPKRPRLETPEQNISMQEKSLSGDSESTGLGHSKMDLNQDHSDPLPPASELPSQTAPHAMSDAELSTEVTALSMNDDNFGGNHTSVTWSSSTWTPSTTPTPETATVNDKKKKSEEPAGVRFWKALNKDRPEHLERFFRDIFTIDDPLTGKVSDRKIIKPYYQQGKMAGYIRTGGEDVVLQDNAGINISAMLVSKQFRDAGSRLVYSTHIFHFPDPINCQWWCKHIGEVNFSNIRQLAISPITGWGNVRVDEISTLDLSQEEWWVGFLAWLRPRHQLQTLFVDLTRFPNAALVRSVNDDRRDELHHWQSKLRDVLFKFRGLKRALIYDDQEALFNREECTEWQMIMQQPPESSPKHQVKETLGQFLKRRRIELEAAEKEIQRVEAAKNKKKAAAKQEPQQTTAAGGGSVKRMGTYGKKDHRHGQGGGMWGFDSL